MIVADSGPIIAFARLGRLDLLRQVVGELAIPDAVYDELVVKGKGRPGAEEVERGGWIRRKAVRDQMAIAQPPSELDQGEREAIMLAQELGVMLLVDEWKVRKAAVPLGIEVFGVLRVLAEAKRRGFIPKVRPIIEELLAIGYWMHETRVIRPFLREIGEEEAKAEE